MRPRVPQPERQRAICSEGSALRSIQRVQARTECAIRHGERKSRDLERVCGGGRIHQHPGHTTQGMTSGRTVEVQRWLRAVENATFGVWDLDPLLETVHYSPKWKARLGFPRLHAADSTGFWRCRVHPDDFYPMHGSLRAHLDGHASSYEMRFRLRSNGSGYRTMLSRGRVVARDPHGNATRMMGTMVDLTGRPATATPHGLAMEEPEHACEVARSPLHAVLRIACSPTGMDGSAGAAHEARQLIALVSDLLDMALNEATPHRNVLAGEMLERESRPMA